ncbi:hypothetical protein [Gemmobacter lutimaris]|uniref:hypothetical protein n=1 Tax=Gemmobacter lutimaris TaxID=2306023 RepID=UPI0011C4625B|nr:hypothetical protein [Gemmobacter lutimaris]
MSSPEIWATVVFLGVCFLSYLVYGPAPSSELHDTNSGEVVSLIDLGSRAPKAAGIYHAVLIRQSGNVYRDLGLFPSAQAALAEACKSFRRASVEMVRITHCDETSMAVYRKIYNFRGRAEGKKLAGVTIRLVEAAPSRPIDQLEISFRDAENKGGTKWVVYFNYRCKKCGGTKIETPDAKNELGVVFCEGCGHNFGTLAEVSELSNRKAEYEVLRLESERAGGR